MYIHNIIYIHIYMHTYIHAYISIFYIHVCILHINVHTNSILVSIQEEYRNEGIEWVNIDYFNNDIICKMIEASPGGMIPILDEECIRPGEDDDRRVLMHMNKKLSDHVHYSSNATGMKELQREVEFRVSFCYLYVCTV